MRCLARAGSMITVMMIEDNCRLYGSVPETQCELDAGEVVLAAARPRRAL